RRGRHGVVIATQVTSMVLAFALAALTLSGTVRVWEVGLLAALGGVVSAFDIPARQAFIVEMVGREDLPNAIALNSSMFFAARVLDGGPRALGLLMGATGVGALAGALTLAARTSVRGLGRWAALAAACFGTTLVLFSASRSLLLSEAVLVLVGFSMMVQLA